MRFYDLDTSISNSAAWATKHPIYCPAPHCTAHHDRWAPCGDRDGPYCGVHTARLRAARRWPTTYARKVARLRAAGLTNPEVVLDEMTRAQDIIDSGFLKRRRQGRAHGS